MEGRKREKIFFVFCMHFFLVLCVCLMCAGLIEAAIVAQYDIRIGCDSKNDTCARASRKVNHALELQEPAEP